MKPTSLLCTFAALACTQARADIISVAATQSGNYAADGLGNINSLGFQNYFVGYSSPSAIAERRNFFIFPTASFETATILSAELVLYIPKFAPGLTTDPGDGYISPDPSETYRLSSVPFSATVVGDPTNSPATSVPIWSSLGTGSLAGAIEIFPADKGSYIHILLTADAVAGLNAAGPPPVVMGGRLTSLDHSRPSVLDELVFSFTDMPGSGVFAPPTLLLTVVPAPATAIPLLLVSALAARRRRQAVPRAFIR